MRDYLIDTRSPNFPGLIIVLFPFLRGFIFSPLYFLKRGVLEGEIFECVSTNINFFYAVENLSPRVCQDGIGQLDIHEFIHCLQDPVVSLPALDFHHNLRVFRHFEKMQGKLNNLHFTIFLGFVSSSSAILLYNG